MLSLQFIPFVSIIAAFFVCNVSFGFYCSLFPLFYTDVIRVSSFRAYSRVRVLLYVYLQFFMIFSRRFVALSRWLWHRSCQFSCMIILIYYGAQTANVCTLSTSNGLTIPVPISVALSFSPLARIQFPTGKHPKTNAMLYIMFAHFLINDCQGWIASKLALLFFPPKHISFYFG